MIIFCDLRGFFKIKNIKAFHKSLKVSQCLGTVPTVPGRYMDPEHQTTSLTLSHLYIVRLD